MAFEGTALRDWRASGRLYALALGNLCWLSGAAYLLSSGTEIGHLAATHAASVPPMTPDLSVKRPTMDVTAIKEKPLLHATRAYYVAPPQPAKPAAPPLPDYRLAGVMHVPRKPTLATLVNNGTKAVVKVRVGETLDGWAVESVTLGKIVLRYDSQRVELNAGTSKPASGLQRTALARGSSNSGITILASASAASTTVSSEVTAYESQPRLYRPPP